MEFPHGEWIAPDVQADVLEQIPEEAGQYEWIDGRITEVSEPMRDHGWVNARVTVRLASYVEEHELGAVFSHDTFFLLQEEPRIVRGPDIAFVDKSHPIPAVDGVWAIAPDLVVEVQSTSQWDAFMRKKIDDFLRAGTRLAWVINPKTRTVVRYRPGDAPITLRDSDVIDGEDVVPGFRCPINEFFP
jgi:Uma2 family endonuclease